MSAIPVGARSGDAARKAIHMGMGLFALTLKWLTWQQAAAAAVVAILFNVFVLPRLGGRRIHKPGEENHRWSAGVVLYPVTVLLLVLLFRNRLEIAASAWALLAVGDALASIVGRAIVSAKLPWNPDKSWAGFVAYVVFGGLAAGWIILWVRPGIYSGAEMMALAFCGAVVGAIFESLPVKIDDNVVAPLAAGAFSLLLARTFDGPNEWERILDPEFLRFLGLAVGVNALVAALAFFTGILELSGVLAGFAVGTVLLGFAGWPGYALLWAFFALGTLATKWKYSEKAKLGAAQDRGGRRGAKHALANCGLAAIFSILLVGAGRREELETFRLMLRLGIVAAFATALADTLGSELGSVYGKNPRLITTWKRVAPGTDGAISLAGTLGGVCGATLVAGLAFKMKFAPKDIVLPAILGAVAGSAIESVLGATLEKKKLIDNEAQNFLNTVVGALAAVAIARLLGVHR